MCPAVGHGEGSHAGRVSAMITTVSLGDGRTGTVTGTGRRGSHESGAVPGPARSNIPITDARIRVIRADPAACRAAFKLPGRGPEVELSHGDLTAAGAAARRRRDSGSAAAPARLARA